MQSSFANLMTFLLNQVTFQIPVVTSFDKSSEQHIL